MSTTHNTDFDLLHCIDVPYDCSYPEDELSDFYAELREQYDRVNKQDNPLEYSCLYGSCICGFAGVECFKRYRVGDREKALESMRQKHTILHEYCSASLITFTSRSL